LEFLKQNMFPKLEGLTGDERITAGIEFAENTWNFTRDDIVHMVVRAVGTKFSSSFSTKRFERVFYKAFYPIVGLTALELTTAGTGVAMLEILEKNPDWTGVRFGGAIPYELLWDTKVGSMFTGPLL
jgi:hypothetical protein